MSDFRTILFDLDGTLTDPRKGIFNSFHYALNKLGITEEKPQEMLSLIGPPLQVSFKERYGLTGSKVGHAVSYYREYFGDTGLFENEIYEGIADLLDGLKRAGKRLLLATTKADIFANRILEHFKIRDYFDYVSCATFDGSRVDKGEIISHALKEMAITDKKQVVMVGDRKFDILGAKENAIASIAVTYGFGSADELEMVRPDFTVSSVAELSALLI
jgi:phosphoglycolate phosphatase